MTRLCNGNRLTIVALSAALTISGVAFAQQATTSDPYSGVSQPPPDSTIVANPDATANSTTQPAPSQPAKPSPDIPASAPDTAPAVTAAPAPPPVNSPATPASNPDYDIVSSVPGQSATPAASGDVALQTRPNTDDDIVSAVPSSANNLAEGTNIRVRLTEKLSTTETSVGAAFKGDVTKDVYKDGRVIIPAGSELKGRVIGVTQGRHFGPSATLRLRPDLVLLPDGTAYHLYAEVAGSDAPGTRTDSEGGIQPKSHLVKNAAAYGVGAGTGAVIGAYVAGPGGALAGTLVGAGVITAHLLLQHPSAAVVPKGSVVTFSLTEPMELTPTRN